MKKSKIFAVIGGLGVAALSVFLISADHIDAPAVAGTTADITDFYAFQSEKDNNNFVFVANVQGLLTPGQATDQAAFDETVLLEFNIDSNNDLKEDLVIQAIKRGDSMYFFGPSAPAFTGADGLNSTVLTTEPISVKISTKGDLQVTEKNGMKFFAGPREDPFFFDFNRYNEVLATPGTVFNNPGTDTFAGSNVLSVVMEFPKSLLKGGKTGVNPFAENTPIFNVWAEAKRKQ